MWGRQDSCVDLVGLGEDFGLYPDMESQRADIIWT